MSSESCNKEKQPEARVVLNLVQTRNISQKSRQEMFSLVRTLEVPSFLPFPPQLTGGKEQGGKKTQ